MSFEQEIRSNGFDAEPEPRLWFYISFVRKDGGAFLGAVVVEAPNRVAVADEVIGRSLLPPGAKVGFITEIPADRVPDEGYRNTLLTREQVETMWPRVKR